MLEDAGGLTREDLATMQMDSLILTAVDAIPRLVKLLSGVADPRVHEALSYLESWDCQAETDRVGASIWELFIPAWSAFVSDQQFQGEYRDYLSASGALVVELLSEDTHGWTTGGSREEAALAAMHQALDRLTELLGPDMSTWAWGRMGPANARLTCWSALASPLRIPGTTTTRSSSAAACGSAS